MKTSLCSCESCESFRPYLVGTTVIAYVPNVVVKDIFRQSETTGRRCKWINQIQEFKIDLQITKLVRGQGLAKLMAKSNLEATRVNQVELEDVQISIERCPWYANIVYYLKYMKCTDRLNDSQKITLKFQTSRYVLLNGDLYWENRDGILLLCLDECRASAILRDLHEGVCGGHFSTKTVAHKILNVGYYWPQIFKDCHAYIRKCEACQKISRKLKYNGAIPLRPMHTEEPFQMWGIDSIREIENKSSGGHKWILVATDYFTKWVEAIHTRQATSKVVIKFLLENILTRFGVPQKIMVDNGMCFRSNEFSNFC